MGQVYVRNGSPSLKDKKTKSVNIHIGVFFDGTSNNFYNTDYRKKIPTKNITIRVLIYMIVIGGTIQMSLNYITHTLPKGMILKFI
ncbi:hypothetical protein [Prevotella multiformis]|uniref:hypothetical protein n=1 Tax=Prevotella multiformis TaxID=282402 RepID=UPI0028DD3A68|nr:hypothetical protein [Prevotella multiformis]